ncbi:SGNH/GDSL hydrolase family protein [Pseudomonas sp. NFX224]|uniref:SGNH/GDSL hydrolase family protein n=1 Tax=Pseudomonas sp. NFX224 TaxID=3402862 RepID=UPI003AFADB4A
MELKSFFAQDDLGNALPAATCYLYERGTENIVLGLRKSNGLGLLNPFLADANGLVQFAAPNGLYDLRITKGKRDYRLPVQFLDVTESLAEANGAALRAESARDAAQLAAGVKASPAEGLRTTTDGMFFTVVSPENAQSLILFKNEAGVAVEQTRYPSSTAVETINNFVQSKFKVQTVNDTLMAVRDAAGHETWMGINNRDGGPSNWALKMLYKYLGVKPANVPGLLYAFPDALGRLTDLSIRDTDGQVPDWVIFRWAKRLKPLIGGDDSHPKTAYNNISNLPQMRMKQGQIRAGVPGVKLYLKIIGDSYSAGQYFYVNDLTRFLAKDFGFGGSGYIGFNHGASLGAKNFLYSNSSLSYFGGSWTLSPLGAASPDNRTIKAGAAGDYVSITAVDTADISTVATLAKLLFLGDGTNSTLRYRWGDALEWNTLSLSGTGPQQLAFPVLPAGGNWKFRMEVVTGTPTLFGLYTENSTSGVVVSKCAASGSASGDWYKNDAAWLTQQKTATGFIPADAVLIMLGGNDQGASVPPETFLANLQGVVASHLEVHPGASFIVAMRWETTRTSQHPMSAYTKLVAAWCWSQGLAFMDMQYAAMGDPAKYASTGETPLISTDKIHPDPVKGSPVISSFFYTALR